MSAVLSPTGTSSPLFVFEISESASERFNDLLSAEMDAANARRMNEVQLCQFARNWQFLMNRTFPKLVTALRELGQGDGAESLLIRGLPASRDEDDLCLSRVVSAMLAQSLNARWGPMQYLQEKGGALWSVLKVNRHLACEQSGQGAIRFEHHNDFAWLGSRQPRPERVKPRFNILAGIRNAGATMTNYASVADVVRHDLSFDEADALMQPDFRLPVPDEMGLARNEIVGVPILWRDSRDRVSVQIRAGAEVIDARNQLGANAIEKLQDGLRRNERSMCIRRGDYALVNNIHGTHSRNAIDDDNERLLIRLYAGALSALRARTHAFDARLFLDAN